MNKTFYDLVTKELQELDEIPLFGKAPSINLTDLSALLSKQFGIEDCSIQIKEQGWKEKQIENVKQVEASIHISPFDTPLYWTMLKADRDKLLLQMMFQKQKKGTHLSSPVQEGFYQFILLEALSGAQMLEPIREMTLLLGEKSLPPQEKGIEITLELTLGNFSTWGKLFIPDTFRKAWVQHFAAFPPQYVPSNLSKTLNFKLGIKVGEIELPLNEWKKLKPGDFLFPDTFYPSSGTIVLGKTPLFNIEKKESTQFLLKDFAFMEDESIYEEMPTNKEILEPETVSHKLETSDEMINLKKVSLNISIELTQLKMSLDELMKLSPGNLIEVPALAEKRVALVANGQKIGVAEIVELEDSLGLKILEI